MVAAVDEHSDRKNEGVALNLALGIDRDEIIAAIQELVDRLTANPRVLGIVWQELAIDLASVTMGMSSLDPQNDNRFSDPAWQDNPFYKRMGQYYMAWGKALDTWVENSDLEDMNRKRASYLLGILKDLLAPVNSLQGNPQAMKILFESRGQSLSNGIKNMLDDYRHNYGYPGSPTVMDL